jgi:hypothetical protein
MSRPREISEVVSIGKQLPELPKDPHQAASTIRSVTIHNQIIELNGAGGESQRISPAAAVWAEHRDFEFAGSHFS